MISQLHIVQNKNLILKVSISNGSTTQIELDIDRKTMLEELFDFLIDNKYLDNYKRYWTCYSNISKTFLTELYKSPWIDKQEDHLLFIPTSQVYSYFPNIPDQQYNTTSTLTTEFKGQKIEEEEQVQQVEVQDFGRKISVYFNIQDGLISRFFKQTFSENEILNLVAESVLKFLGLDHGAASVDLYLYNTPLNNFIRRRSTLKELFPNCNEISLNANVRWIGG